MVVTDDSTAVEGEQSHHHGADTAGTNISNTINLTEVRRANVLVTPRIAEQIADDVETYIVI